MLEDQKNSLENEVKNEVIKKNKVLGNIQLKESDTTNQSNTKSNPLKFFSNAIDHTKNTIETTILQNNLKTIDNEITKLSERLNKKNLEIQECNLKIADAKNNISLILSQRQKGFEIYEKQWINLEEIQKLKQIKIGLANNFSEMSPFDFEHFTALLLQEMGYQTEVTKKTGDYGVDIIAIKNNQRIAVQCKRFQEGHPVGNRDIQNLLGSMGYYRVHSCILVTTSDFTKNAREQSKNSPIELWNKEKLHELVKKHLLKFNINEVFDSIESQKRNAEKKTGGVNKKSQNGTISKEDKGICPRCGGGKMKTRKYCSKCKTELRKGGTFSHVLKSFGAIVKEFEKDSRR